MHNFGDEKFTDESEIRVKFPASLSAILVQDSNSSNVSFTTEVQTVSDPLKKIVFKVKNPKPGLSNTYNSYFEYVEITNQHIPVIKSQVTGKIILEVTEFTGENLGLTKSEFDIG